MVSWNWSPPVGVGPQVPLLRSSGTGREAAGGLTISTWQGSPKGTS